MSTTIQKPKVVFPRKGTVVSVPIEIGQPASVCFHHEARRPMCTIIPLENKPDPDADGPWILSPWGNGPGIVCFLVKWDGEEFYDVEIVKVQPHSVLAAPLEPHFDSPDD
jgi:hypothetical protein